MTTPPTMTPLRRNRSMPGMSSPAPASPSAATEPEAPVPPTPRDEFERLVEPGTEAANRSQDYSATRLVSFRLPVDLHDRCKALVQDLERRYPRLRRPSVTEVVIALLEEGPDSVEQIAELLQRKRAAEHSRESLR
jgi:hypothetical protein